MFLSCSLGDIHSVKQRHVTDKSCLPYFSLKGNFISNAKGVSFFFDRYIFCLGAVGVVLSSSTAWFNY